MNTPVPAPQTTLPIVDLTADDLDDILDTDSAAFGFDAPPDFVDEVTKPTLELDRFVGARDPEHDGLLVAVAGIYSKRITFPGGAAQPAAGVTWVGVRPGWRRRGLLRGMIVRQLHDLHDQRREPVAILTASEAGLYIRYGYGLAIRRGYLQMPLPAALRPDVPADPVHEVPAAGARPAVEEIYARAATRTPGMLQRPDPVWRARFSDHAEVRGRASRLRVGLHPDGFVTYRLTSGWNEHGPDYRLRVHDLCAATPRAHASLWRYLLGMDLVRRIEYDLLWLDDPLTDLLQSPRAANVRLADHVWLRLVDLDRSIPLRRYAAPATVVVEVTDDICPWNAGRWELRLGRDGGSAVRTQATAEIALDIADLGACMIGGSRLARLAQAGRVNGAAAALGALDLALSTPLAPWCPEGF